MRIGWQDERIARGMATQMAALGAAEAKGQQVIGWKVGFGAPAAMEKLRLQAPVVGYLLGPARLESGTCLPVAGWVKPVIEPEVAVVIGRDLSGDEDRATVRAAIEALAPALELADLEFAPDDVERIVAADIYQRHVIIGSPFALAAASPGDALMPGLTAQVWRNEEPLAVPSPLHALTGDPVDVVAHVAATLARNGRCLRAGEIVITGSIVPPVFGCAGESVRYSLEGVGEVSVALG